MPSNEANKNDSPQNWFDKAKALALYLPHLLGKEIWRTDKVDDKSLRGSGFALLRILTITVEGILRNRVPSQAGALSYYTLIAIAPTLAIGIMVAGFVFQGDDAEDKIVDGLTQLIYYIAPPAEQATGAEMGSFFDDLDARHPLISSEQSTAEEKPDLDEVSTEEAKANVDPKIQEGLQGMVRGLVKAARSGTLGAFGSLMLIWISVQLLSTIEKTFNQIWGVKQARNLMQRLVFYWTLISLGALLGFTSLSIGIYGQIAQQFDSIPFGGYIKESFLWLIPLWTFISVVTLLAIFNRFIPNTQVRWKPAFLGALLVAILLKLNQQLSFLYVGFVIRQGSLLGVVGILPIFLFGLWLFWVILLLGGQITFAIQNVNNLTNQRAWEDVSLRTRETLGLAALLLIARRFDACKKPYSADELADHLRVPGNILNECLGQLVEVGFLSIVEDESERRNNNVRYQPARPLEKITLAGFKEKLETRGNNQGVDLVKDMDPVLEEYDRRLLAYQHDEYAGKSLKALFGES